jgi:hypothetical protein
MELSDVEPLVGQLFDVPADAEGEVYVQLTLISASAYGQGNEFRAVPFSLLFDGPSSHPLEQGSYPVRHETLGEQAIFLVPISDNGTVRQYQAIFN